jgi:hypothetical protein
MSEWCSYFLTLFELLNIKETNEIYQKINIYNDHALMILFIKVKDISRNKKVEKTNCPGVLMSCVF